MLWKRDVDLVFWCWCALNTDLALWTNADLAFWSRDAGLNLAFCSNSKDCNCNFFNLLTTSAVPPSSLSIPVESQGLLETLDNQKLQSSERIVMVGLIFTIALIMCRCISPTGLLRDVEADCVGCTRGFQNLFRSDVACVVSRSTGHFWRNLWRYLRVSPWRDFAVLSYCLGASRVRGKKFFKLLLVEFNDEGFHCPPEEIDVSLRHGILISRE